MEKIKLEQMEELTLTLSQGSLSKLERMLMSEMQKSNEDEKQETL